MLGQARLFRGSFVLKYRILLMVIAGVLATYLATAQNKIVFTDDDVSHHHYVPADSPLGKVDHSYQGKVEKSDEYSLNSVYNEHGPLVEPGGERLYFSRSNHPDNVGGLKDAEDIWVASWDKVNHTWTNIKRLPAPLNTYGPNFVTSISVEDGVITLILGNEYTDGEISGEGLSFSELKNGKWSRPINFTIKDFKNKSKNVDFFVSEDGKLMLISAEMDDSKGGRDIYLSKRINKRTWDTPTNLSELNTEKDETSPSFSPDGRFLFFSTAGFDGFGRQDIFYTTKVGDSWTQVKKPKNMGAQFNDAEDNTHFSLPPAGEKIFFISAGKDDNMDIFSFATSTEQLYSELTGEPICLAERVFLNESFFSHKLECNICVDLEYRSEKAMGDVKYRWDFGDSMSDEGIRVSHCYNVHGNYDIKLSILDAATDKVISEVDHFYDLNESLELKMETPTAGVINQELGFKSHLAGGYPANAEFFWDFGDGYFSCGENVNHTYILPGDYIVRALTTFEWQGRVRYLETEKQLSVRLNGTDPIVTANLKD